MNLRLPLLLLMLFGMPLAAAEQPTDVVIETPADETYQIGLLLRCPVCQGMPIAESPAEMAQAMMTRIREMHREGKSREEILAYFVDRYGQWVVLEPKAEGLNWLVWVLPPLLLLACILGLLRFIRRERAEAEALPEEVSVEIENEYLKTIRQDVLH
jgi:cytochrome c-type biogenesis protein CcmH